MKLTKKDPSKHLPPLKHRLIIYTDNVKKKMIDQYNLNLDNGGCREKVIIGKSERQKILKGT